MKEYKLVVLNKHMKMSRESDMKQATETLNEYIQNGWKLQEVVCPADMIGSLVGVLYKGED